MISEMLWTMAVLATLALGFLLGRMWEIRREILRDRFSASPWRKVGL